MRTSLPILTRDAARCCSRLFFFFLPLIAALSFSASSQGQSTQPELVKLCSITEFSDASNGHALFLANVPGISDNKYEVFPGAPGTLELFSDGTARIKARVRNKSDNSLVWDVDFHYTGGSDWTSWSAGGGNYKDEASLAGSNFLDWDYFIFDASKSNTLTGVDGLAGSSLTVTHKPANFEFGLQIGTAANSKNANDGASVWFYIDGTVLGNAVSGHGDLNLNTACSEILTNCPLEQYAAGDHILWLPGVAAGSDWVPAPFGVYFAELAGGEARLYGEIQNQNDPSLVLCLDLWFSDKADFATWSGLGRGIKGNASNINGNEVNWDFYIFNPNRVSSLSGCSASTLGSYITLEHKPADYNFGLQVGLGANDKNAQFGLSVWFFTEGAFQGNAVDGHGDVNSINLCPPPPNIICFDNPPIITCPADTIVDCSADTAPEFLGEATADRPTPECPLDVAIFFEDDIDVNGCETVITRTWTVIDEYDNIVSCDQLITVVDTTAPTLLMPVETEGDITCSDISLDAATGFANNTLTQAERQDFLQTARQLFIDNGLVPLGTEDDCNDSDWDEVSIEVTVSNDCDALATLLCTFAAEDVCLNTSEPAATSLNIIDTVAPVITCPDDMIADCAGDTSPAATGSATATDDCGQEVMVSSTDQVSGTCPQVITRTWTATDACGNTATCEQVITTADSEAPVFDPFDAELTADCSDDIQGASLTATDNCSTPTVVCFEGNQSLDVSGPCTPFDMVRPQESAARSGWFPNMPGTSGSGSKLFTLEEGTYQRFDDGTVHFYGTMAAVDNDQLAWQFSIWLRGGYDWTEWSGLGRTYKDEGIAGIDYLDWTYYEMDDTKPNVMAGIRDYAGSGLTLEHDPPNYNYGFQVGQSANVFTETFGISGWMKYTGTILYQGESFERNNQKCDFNLNLECGPTFLTQCETTAINTCIATDDCGNFAIATQTTTITDTTAPEIVCPADAVVSCNDDTSPAALGMATAEDDCNDVIDISFEDGTVTGTCPEVFTRTWTATDACGNTSSCDQLITVADNEAPVKDPNCEEPPMTFYTSDGADCPSDAVIDVEVGDEIDNTGLFTIAGLDLGAMNMQLAPCFSDNCTDDLTYIVRSVDNGDPAEECSKTIVVEIEAMDDCGNVSVDALVCTFIIEDDVAPVKDPNCEEPPMTFYTSDGADCPSDAVIDVEVGDVIDNTGLFTIAGLDLGAMNMQLAPCFSDDCADDLIYVVRSVDNGDPSETCSKTIVVEIEAMDECGNVSVDALVCTFIIEDDVAPELEMPAETEGDITCADISVADAIGFANGTLTPEEEAAFLEAAAALFVSNGLVPVGTTDDCNGSDWVEVSIDVTLGDDCDIATLTCTFAAVDDCGNESAPAATSLNLIDNTAPVITCPSDVEVDCSADNSPASTGMATATDDCGAATVTFADSGLSGDGCVNTFTRTWTATDACGNASTCAQVITITDTTAPELEMPTVLEGDVTCSDISLQDAEGFANGTLTIEERQAFLQTARQLFNSNGLIPLGTEDDCNDSDWVEVDIEVTLSADCDALATLICTFVAVDVCGNTSGEIASSLNIIDDTAPVITCPADAMVSCGDDTSPSAIGEATATDDCGQEVMVTFADGATSGDCVQTFIRTWTATDACGNASTCDQTITITDDEAPVAPMAPENATASCDEELPMAPELVAADACQGDVIGVLTEETVPGSCANNFTIVRTWTFDDGCGNVSSVSSEVVVSDTEAPVINVACQLNIDLFTSEGFDCPSDAGFSFAEGDEFSVFDGYTFAGQGLGAFIGCVTDNCTADENITMRVALITETGDDCSKSFTVDWEAIDECGNVGGDFSCNYTITDDVAPELEMPAETEGDITCADISVADATGFANGTLTPEEEAAFLDAAAALFVSNGLVPVGTTDDCNGSDWVEVSIDVTLGDDCDIATLTCTFAAVDDCGNESAPAATSLNLIDNTAPVITCPSDVEVDCSADNSPASTGMATATDDCGAATVTFADSGLSGDGCVNTFTRTWTATDACGNASTCAQVITITDTTAPELEMPTVLEGDVTCSDISLQDAEGFANGTLTIEERQAFLQTARQLFNSNGLIPLGTEDDCNDSDWVEVDIEVTLSADCDALATLICTFVAVDVCGNTSGEIASSLNIIDDTAPVITCPADAMVSCGDDTSPSAIGEATATDDCGQEVMVTFADGATSGDCVQTFIRTWTATDACGNASTCDQTITITDDEAPVAPMAPENATASCDEELPMAPELVAADACQGDVIGVLSEETVPGSCVNNFTIVRTWTFDDGCGNVSSVSSEVVVSDTEAPVFNLACELDFDFFTSEGADCPADAGFSFAEGDEFTVNDGYTIGGIDILPLAGCVFDNCTAADDLIIRVAAITESGDDCVKAFTVDFEAIDECGNVGGDFSCNYTITDDVAPELEMPVETEGDITCADISVADAIGFANGTLTPEEEAAFLDAAAALFVSNGLVPVGTTDDCNGSDWVEVSIDVTLGDDCDIATLTCTFAAVDDCGNESAPAATSLNLIDNTAPVITCPSDVEVDCSADNSPASTGMATATDDCGAATVTFADSGLSGDGCVNTFTRTWTATDACGNASTCAQVITITDTTAPELEMPTVLEGDVTCSDISLQDAEGFANGTLTIEERQAFLQTARQLFNSNGLIPLGTEDDCNDSDWVEVDIEVTLSADCDALATLICTFVAVDVCGNTSGEIASSLNIIDDTAPVITCPADAMVSCGDDTSPSAIGEATATDDCGQEVMVTFADGATSGDCVQTFIRTWTATDACGNASTCDQTITITDDEAPVAPMAPENATASCDEELPMAPELVAADACQGDVIGVLTEETVPGSCVNNFTIVRTWTFDDGCGNVSSVSSEVVVSDTEAPVFNLACELDFDFFTSEGADCPADAGFSFAEGDEFTVNDGYTIGGIDILPLAGCVFDNCTAADDLIIRVAAITESGDDCVKAFTVDFEAIDECGNVGGDFSCNYTITDDVAPELEMPVETEGDITCADISVADAIGFANGTLTPEEEAAFLDAAAALFVSNGLVPVGTTDDCNGSDWVEVSIDVTLGDDCDIATLTCTFAAVDDCGNESAPAATSLNLIDNTAPVITCPSDVEVDCSADNSPASTGMATATDDCGAATVTFADSGLSGDGCVNTFTRTWTATDACGNASTCAQVITITDTTAPELEMPTVLEGDVTCSDISLQDAEGFANGTLTIEERQAFLQTARQLFNSNGLIPLGTEDDCNDSDWVEVDIEVTLSADCDALATLICTFVAVDVCGNTSGEIASSLNIIDDTAPVITCPADAMVSCGDDTSPSAIGEATATDDCGQEVMVTFADGATSGDCVQTFIRTWTATDACGNASTCDQTITITDDEAPVAPMAPENATASCDEELPMAPELVAADACQGDVIGVLTEETVPGSCVNNFTIVRTWTFDDGCGNVSSVSSEVVVSDTEAPVFNLACELDFDFFTSEGADCPADAGFSFAEGDEFTVNDGYTIGGIDILPLAGCVFDNCTAADDLIIRVAAITESGDDCVKAFTVDFEAIDECGNVGGDFSCNYTITDDVAPELEMPAETEGDITCADISVADAIGFANGTLTPEEEAAFLDAAAALFVSNGLVPVGTTDDCNGSDWVEVSIDVTLGDDCDIATLTCTFAAVDDCGNESAPAATSLNLIDNTAPVITCPSDVEVDCSADNSPASTGMATATDDCGAATVTFADSGLSGDGCVNTFTRTWTATDACGNASTCAQVITITDTTAPELEMPTVLEGDVTCSDISLQDAEGFANGTLTIEERQAFLQTARQLFNSNGLIPLGTEDDCNDSDWVEVDIEVTLSADCDALATLICTFVAVDVCGNTSGEIASSLNIIDDTAPVITCPADAMVSCGDDTSPSAIGEATATDDCGQEVMVTFADGATSGDCVQTFIRTWTATDACGNASTCDQTITITDDEAPVAPMAPENATASCDEELPMAPELVAADACQGDVIGVLSEETVPGSCVNNFTIVRTWTFDDGCGNVSSVSSEVVVSDTEAPVFDLLCQFDFEIFTSEGFDCPSDAGFSFEEGDEFPITQGYTIAGRDIASLSGCVTDNCTADDNIIIRAALITEVGDGCSTTFTVDFEAIDECGNVGGDFSCNYTVIDDVAPELIMPEQSSMHITCMAVDYAMLLDYVDGNLTSTQEDVYLSFIAGLFMQNGLVPIEAVDDCNDASFFETGIEITTDVDCPSKASIKCIFVGVDVCGNQSEPAYTELVVIDNTTPHIFCPADIVVTCGSDTSPDVTGFASATDNCVGIMDVSYVDLYVSDLCPSSFVRLWTASDECGNIATCEQLITTVEESDCATAPSGLEVTVEGSNSVQFSWDPVPNSVGCRVFGRGVGGNANFTLGTVMGDEPSELTFTSGQLTNGRSFEWRVVCACELAPLNMTPFSPWTIYQFLFDDNKSNEASNNDGELLKGELYPNPTRTSVFVNSEFEEGDILTVMDLSGKVVGQYNVPVASGLFEINLAELESGVYFVQHSGLNGRSQTFKVVKNN